ncbi:MAG TPA: hypothetical protein VFH48_24760 [Chloroflexota bacterium]|nr:hypothetical protein [Chloroflexota bacterium]
MAITCQFVAAEIRRALHYTFTTRSAQSVPSAFPEPPSDWPSRYERLARGLSITPDSREAHRIVATFLDPLLSGAVGDDMRWDLVTQTWIVG